jgi:transposase
MIDYDLFRKIKNLNEQHGLTPSQIAGELAIDPRTVMKWLHEERFRQRSSPPRQCKLDPFKNDILRMVTAHPYSAAQVLARIRENGFDGGYTIVKDYLRTIRPRRSPAYLTLSFAPGECAQVDWGSFGTVPVGATTRRLSFFVMVLCYSRMMYLEFTVSQTMEHFLACHQHAFEAFGGVPAKVMTDNLKSAVIKRIIGADPVFNPRYLDFAHHYGFAISACNVGKGNEKGRVENGVGYVKKNFLSGLDIPDFGALNPAARIWLDTIANVRIHGATRQKPIDLLEKERPYLRPLPEHPFDIATVVQARASSQFRMTLDTNRYSVPAEYAGTPLTLKLYPDRLCVYQQEKLIARHHRCYDRHQDIEDPDHPKALLAQRKKARDQKMFMRFLSLSPKADAYWQQLEQRRMNPAHHVRKIVALSEIYGPDAVARAMADAFVYQAFSSEYIANILEQRARFRPEPGALHLTRREDLLDITVAPPDLSIYHTRKEAS